LALVTDGFFRRVVIEVRFAVYREQHGAALLILRSPRHAFFDKAIREPRVRLRFLAILVTREQSGSIARPSPGPLFSAPKTDA
jgi:hypothetical protein